jgi:hypothetical protein
MKERIERSELVSDGVHFPSVGFELEFKEVSSFIENYI